MASPIAPGGASPAYSVNNMALPDAGVHTPNHRVGKVDRSKVDPEIVKVGEGMEALFLDYMMSAMRKTVPENDMDGNSQATKIYQSMLDSEVSQRAAHQGGIGLADLVIAYMAPNSYNQEKGQGAPLVNTQVSDVRTGGTKDEGQQ